MILRLQYLRKAKGISQSELSRLTGIHRTLIARYEGGVTWPGSRKLAKMADALGCSVDDLIGIADSNEERRRESCRRSQ